MVKNAILVFCFVMIGICWLGMAWCVIMLRRNKEVSMYRQKVINNVYEHNMKDVRKDADPAWRWQAYQSVPYITMMRKFWKPLSSFYKDSKLEKEIWDI